MTYAELVFKAFLGATARVRWFLLITTLLSSLIAVQTFLDQFGNKRNWMSNALVADLRLRAKLVQDHCSAKKISPAACADASWDSVLPQAPPRSSRSRRSEPGPCGQGDRA